MYKLNRTLQYDIVNSQALKPWLIKRAIADLVGWVKRSETQQH
jgi:hypothetical protein